MRRLLLKVAGWFGKSERKVAAVFADSPEACRAAVVHLKQGAPAVPVWLFATCKPPREIAGLVERAHTSTSPLALLIQAERLLWPFWVALCVAPWTGQHGGWALKLAPFLIPPFRALLLNRQGDFLPGTPAGVARHLGRRLHDAGLSVWYVCRAVGRFVRDRAADVWHIVRKAGPLGLLVASPALRWLGYPHCRWFARLHGDQALDPATAPLRSRLGNPDIERMARSVEGRWALWSEEPVLDSALREMLPLLGGENTFAISIQQHFRAWKPLMVPEAPFRALQAGEAARVLAPVSRCMLVDRQKLLALGVPRARLPGVAWRVLFWRAAAAGWTSYSVGTGGRLSELPDAPVEETGFLLRVLADPALRRLGPRNEALARGAAAFSPVGPVLRGRSERIRVLLVSPFLPFPLSHGGAVRIWNLCRSLAWAVDFILVAVREKDEYVDYGRLGEVFSEVHVVDVDERPSADPTLPAQVRQYRSEALRALIADLAGRHDPHVLQVEYTHMAAFRDAAPQVPAILVEHDLTFSLYRQLAENEPKPEAQEECRRWLEFERRWLNLYDGVWTVSDEDRLSAVEEGRRPAETTFTVPNGVDVERYLPEGAGGGVDLLYVGSFRHLPNLIGFDRLLSEVMPRVWERIPDARLRVVGGPQHEKHWAAYSKGRGTGALDPRVEVMGFVEDLRPLYARSAAVLVPLEVSAGTNIKVLEAMACGRAVVSTPVGCAGLGLQDGMDALIRPDWASFAAAVCELLADGALRGRLARAGRKTAEERFSWTAIARGAYETYLAINARRGLTRGSAVGSIE